MQNQNTPAGKQWQTAMRGKGGLLDKLGIFILAFFVMIIVLGFFKGLFDSLIPDGRNAFLLTSVLQSLLAFILPAWLVARIYSASPSDFLGTDRGVSTRNLAGILLFMLLGTPALNAIIYWNEHISLPESMAVLETTFRTMEDSAADTTDTLLGDTSIWGLVSGILVVGLLTGFAEECFFRGGLQKIMTSSGVNRHVAVWTAALIFSAIHFQFFGFVPRLLLGAFFGYLYLTTGSLWVAASAHAINNSFVVILTWLQGRGIVGTGWDMIGVEGTGSTLTAVGSMLMVAGCAILLWKPLFKRTRA